MSKYIARSIEHPLIININNNTNNIPDCFIDISKEIIGKNRKFNKFALFFEDLFLNRIDIGKFIQFYYKAGIYNSSSNIVKYINNGTELFDTDFNNKFIAKTIECLFENENDIWFLKEGVDDIINEIANATDVYFTDLLVENVVNLLWKNYDTVKISRIFNILIDSEINQIGEMILKSIANHLPINEFPLFSSMKLKTCRILILVNSKLVLCPELWKQTRDFQLEILNCINKNKLSTEEIKRTIETILNNSKCAFPFQLYNIFGKLAILIVLSYYERHKINTEWVKIIRCDIDEYFNWIKTIDKLDDYTCIEEMIKIVDSNSYQIKKYEKNIWEKQFQLIGFNNLSDKTKISLAVFLLPIILNSNFKFSNNMVSFVFYTINSKLANDTIDFESWSKIDKFLPEVSWFNSWDKCKRLRKAFTSCGYSIGSEGKQP
jgi:hypothetical protein